MDVFSRGGIYVVRTPRIALSHYMVRRISILVAVGGSFHKATRDLEVTETTSPSGGLG